MQERMVSDVYIVNLFWERDERAITETSRKYGAYCQSIALQILQNIQDAEECVNDTYLKAWDVIPPERPSKLGAFLGKITRNLALDKYKAYRAVKRGGSDFAVSLEELGDCIPDTSADIQSQANAEYIGKVINDFLKSQPTLARKIFVCRYFYSDSITDIAKRFSCSEGKVKSSLFRTRNKLKIHLEKEGITI